MDLISIACVVVMAISAVAIVRLYRNIRLANKEA